MKLVHSSSSLSIPERLTRVECVCDDTLVHLEQLAAGQARVEAVLRNAVKGLLAASLGATGTLLAELLRLALG